jgi:4-amino-4-deoxy-L-arabinose transferase-like glycosyltransferase
LKTFLLVIIVLAAATAVRTVGLGSESLWLDEGFSAQMAESGSLRDWMTDAHPPLYYALLSAWSRAAGSDIGLRSLSVVFGVLTVLVVYATADRMFGKGAAFWSALILAVCQIHVTYSQEVRMYALMVLLFAGTLWAMVEVAYGERNGTGWVAYVACATLLCYSHGVGLLYWATLAAVFFLLMLAKAERGTWGSKYVVANLIVAVLAMPWLGILMSHMREGGGPRWIEAPDLLMPVRILLYDFAIGPLPKLGGALAQHWESLGGVLPGKWLLPLPIAACMAAALFLSERQDRSSLAALLIAMLTPVGVLFIVSLTIRPLLLPKTVLPAVVPYALVLGAAASARKPWRWAGRFLVLLVVVELCGGTFFLHRHAERRGGWQEASQYLQSEPKAGETALVFSAFGLTQDVGIYLLHRYDPAGELGRVRLVNAAPFLTREGGFSEDGEALLSARLRHAQVCWVVERRAMRKRLLREVMAEPYRKTVEEDFTRVRVTRFVKPPEQGVGEP